MAAIDGVILKGGCTVILDLLQTEEIEQLHIDHMGIEN